MKIAKELGHLMVVWILKKNPKIILALAVLVQFFPVPLVNHDKHGSQMFFDLLKNFHPTQKSY